MTAPDGREGMLRAVADAVRFLTRLPVPGGRGAPPPEGEGHSRVHPWTMAFFPVVGLFLGAILWTVAWVLGLFLPHGVTDLALLALLAGLTGAIHWDGLMDTADALGAPPERRLEVLKDVHVGSFGMLALVFVAGAQWGGLASLSGWGHGTGLLLFPVWGRWLMEVVTYGMADLRQGRGLAAAFVAQLEARHLLWGAGFALVCSVVLLGLFRSLVLLAGMLVLGWGLRRLYRSAFGGVSGDLIGAACCLGEAATLWLLAAMV